MPFLSLVHNNLLQLLLSQLFSFWPSDMVAAIGWAPGMNVIPPVSKFLGLPYEKETKLITKPLNFGVLFIQQLTSPCIFT